MLTRNTDRVAQALQYRHAGMNPEEIGKLLGESLSTVYRYLGTAEQPGTKSTTTEGATR